MPGLFLGSTTWKAQGCCGNPEHEQMSPEGTVAQAECLAHPGAWGYQGSGSLCQVSGDVAGSGPGGVMNQTGAGTLL